MPEWLIRDLLFQRQVGVAYAPPGSFKSFVALDLCSRLAHGLEWQGRNLKPFRVIYVAGEGFSMLYHRRLAWFKRQNIEPQDDGLEVVGSAVDLTDADTVQTFIREMQLDCKGLGLVVFDTLSTCTAGQNECDSAVMTTVVESGKQIARELNCAVLFIHHPGKDISRGSRGHSSLTGNIDFEWQITRQGKDMDCTLVVTKQKDAEDGQKFLFKAERIDLALYDSDGDERTSLALTPCHAEGDPRDRRKAADLRSVAYAMTDQPVSVNEMAKRIKGLLRCELRSATDRINAAVPLEWTRAMRGNEAVNIRRVLGTTSRAATMIEIQPVNCKPEPVF